MNKLFALGFYLKNKQMTSRLFIRADNFLSSTVVFDHLSQQENYSQSFGVQKIKISNCFYLKTS